MSLKSVLSTIFIASCCIAGMAQNSSSAKSAHQRIHEQQLANVKSSKMDKSVIDNLLQEDISKRESEVVKGLTKEKDNLLSDILAEASKHIGKPYRHGMKGPNAFDCSGFSSYVYKQFGYSISPASRAQYLEGSQVSRNELRKGDLVFFTSRSSGKNVGHVGIVVEADNATGKFKFIHASIKGVRINECEGYYENRYVGAKRIIQ